MLKKPKPLPHQLLREKLSPHTLKFKSTEELESLSKFLGQERALEALNFGVGIKSQGYNIYAMGPPGIGKLSLVTAVLKTIAHDEPTPNDWCYLHNFNAPDKPFALSLPAGEGSILQKDMKLLVQQLAANILAVFESDEYSKAMQEIEESFNLKRQNSAAPTTEAPLKNVQIPHLYKERHEKENRIQLRFTLAVVRPLINKLKKKYNKNPQIEAYLKAVQTDIIHHVNDFIKRDEVTKVLSLTLDNPALIKYQVNLLVDNANKKGAPVILEENPSYSNLICRVEHISQFGSLITNFTLIRAGALHRANGGYLVIEARKLKKERHVWEGLKRALYARNVRIEPIEDLSETARPISLDPMPIPLNVKVILLGNRGTYYTLSNDDPDFGELFKVAADFDDQIARDKKNINLYARLIGTIASKAKCRPLHAAAVAAIIDHSSRLAEDIEKLSTHIRSIEDVIVEANYWAGIANHKFIKAIDVKKAIQAQIHRLDRTRELYYEDIARDFILINTSDMLIGQVNCLSVVKVGNFSFGHPTRVTAKVRMGKGKITDIQREIKMAGPMHAKAGLIISNFLAGRYNRDRNFSLFASLAFEQIYGRLDGDSASVAELCALLSAIAEIPLKQSLALTGSINQYGEIQAVGGINAKIEGFYDVCKARGLTGKQGVLIPAVNVKNLMLREDVVEAAQLKKFFIYPILNIDQAITLMSGMTAGERNAAGYFPKNSFNYIVEANLLAFSNEQMPTRKTPMIRAAKKSSRR